MTSHHHYLSWVHWRNIHLLTHLFLIFIRPPPPNIFNMNLRHCNDNWIQENKVKKTFFTWVDRVKERRKISLIFSSLDNFHNLTIDIFYLKMYFSLLLHFFTHSLLLLLNLWDLSSFPFKMKTLFFHRKKIFKR
jgi:hypothetical protein